MIEQWIGSRKGITLGGIKVRDLINEGRTPERNQLDI